MQGFDDKILCNDKLTHISAATESITSADDTVMILQRCHTIYSLKSYGITLYLTEISSTNTAIKQHFCNYMKQIFSF